MAVNIRKSKGHKCLSCEGNGGVFYDLGFGKKDKKVITLCDTCMHQLLQKMIIAGGKHEVH